jgi:hypothetical protein
MEGSKRTLECAGLPVAAPSYAAYDNPANLNPFMHHTSTSKVASRRTKPRGKPQPCESKSAHASCSALWGARQRRRHPPRVAHAARCLNPCGVALAVKKDSNHRRPASSQVGLGGLEKAG